jgi:hypothetical protein
MVVGAPSSNVSYCILLHRHCNLCFLQLFALAGSCAATFVHARQRPQVWIAQSDLIIC